MTFSSHNLPYAAADSLFEGFQRILCIFSVVLPTTVRQFFLRTNIQHMLDERETLIICPNPKCCKVYRRSACSTIHDDIGERTNTCSNYPFGRGKRLKICGTPLLIMTKRGSQWYCHSKPSQELIYMGVIRPLERLLQSQIFVDHIWDHLQWQRVDGLYRGVSWVHPTFVLQILIFLSGARRVRWRRLEVLAAASQAKRSAQHMVLEAQCI